MWGEKPTQSCRKGKPNPHARLLLRWWDSNWGPCGKKQGRKPQSKPGPNFMSQALVPHDCKLLLTVLIRKIKLNYVFPNIFSKTDLKLDTKWKIHAFFSNNIFLGSVGFLSMLLLPFTWPLIQEDNFWTVKISLK